MNYGTRKRVILGVAALTVSAGVIAGCKNFLTDASVPQGTLDAGTLSNLAGVEGTLMAAYRQLDFTTGVGGGFTTISAGDGHRQRTPACSGRPWSRRPADRPCCHPSRTPRRHW